MIICPSCKNPARASFYYKEMFVCNCLGVLEDISIIKQKMNKKDSTTLLFGHINFVPRSKDVLGSILSASDGKIYHFDIDKYPYSLGSFVRFKPVLLICENSSLEVSYAEELDLVTPID